MYILLKYIVQLYSSVWYFQYIQFFVKSLRLFILFHIEWDKVSSQSSVVNLKLLFQKLKDISLKTALFLEIINYIWRISFFLEYNVQKRTIVKSALEVIFVLTVNVSTSVLDGNYFKFVFNARPGFLICNI